MFKVSRALKTARYILWLDPGVTTGWALYYIHEDRMIQGEDDFDAIVTRLERWLSTAGSQTIFGCERFVLTTDSNRRPGSLAAIKVWGAAESAARRYDTLLFLDHQNSSAARSFCRDATLRALKWYRLGMPHTNDAARHVFRWLASQGLLTDDQKRMMFSE